MKNVLFTFFMFVVCVAGTVIAAGVYFGLVFSALASLVGASSSGIGGYVGPLAAVLGLPLGVIIFFILTWKSLIRADGQPDQVARGLAVVLGAAIALGGLVAIEPALAVVEAFKVPGFLAVAGFVTLVGWVEQKVRLA
jgi:hypothetical protein